MAILDVFKPVAPTEIIWKPEIVLPFHTNGMKFTAFDGNGTETASKTFFSIGGGDIVEEGQERQPAQRIYHKTTIKEILNWSTETGHSYWEYVDMCEGPEIWDYLAEVWKVMREAVERVSKPKRVLPGGLGVRRKAYSYYMHAERP